MPKLLTYIVVKQQVESFRHLGFMTSLQIQGYHEAFAPKIHLRKGAEDYYFSDPDWNVVVAQLARLYLNLINS